jgi:hypothetical protein
MRRRVGPLRVVQLLRPARGPRSPKGLGAPVSVAPGLRAAVRCALCCGGGVVGGALESEREALKTGHSGPGREDTVGNPAQ